ncbi:MAG: polysaccharide deacetylase family protein [Proteobacteria bacterium]|nr:polysaccharide deacetylase family protein [Pseudomonadota bacterium]
MLAVMFHNVITEMLDPYDRTVARIHGNRFERTLAHCREHYDIVPFDEAMARLNAGADTSRTLIITFDDGFAGVYEVARPILAGMGLVGTVFIMTGRADSAPPDQLMEFERLEIGLRLTSAQVLELPWLGLDALDVATVPARVQGLRRIKQALKQQRAAERRDSMARVLAALRIGEGAIAAHAQGSPRYRKLSSAQVRALLAEGWTIGGHTRSHLSLKGLDEATLRDEVAGNAEDLAAAFGLRHAPFAYPYGSPTDIDRCAREAVKAAGFSAAFTTSPGVNGHSTDLFEICRFSDVALLSQGDSFDRAV